MTNLKSINNMSECLNSKQLIEPFVSNGTHNVFIFMSFNNNYSFYDKKNDFKFFFVA